METNNIFKNITRNCFKESLSEEQREDLLYFDKLLAMSSVGERTKDISLIQPLAAQVQKKNHEVNNAPQDQYSQEDTANKVMVNNPFGLWEELEKEINLVGHKRLTKLLAEIDEIRDLMQSINVQQARRVRRPSLKQLKEVREILFGCS
jgi:hypothetical protein